MRHCLPMRPAILLLTLLATPALAHERLPGFAPDLALRIGGYAAGYSFSTGGRMGEPQLLLNAEGREQFGPLALDASVLGLLGPESNQNLYGGTLRAGYNGSRVRALVGVFMNFDTSAHLQFLPSLTVEAGAGEWRGILGIFDQSGLVPVRLGVAWRDYSLCYLPTLGLEATGLYPLIDALQLEGRAFLYHLVGQEAASLIIGVRWKLPGGAQ